MKRHSSLALVQAGSSEAGHQLLNVKSCSVLYSDMFVTISIEHQCTTAGLSPFESVWYHVSLRASQVDTWSRVQN